MVLEEYRRKRDFERTTEPAPLVPAASAGPLTFVVQKHAARQLHYDLRLEFGQALKSWAIPGGPSTDPQVKRLAVMVEDHPLDYASFEGSIPKGEYGAGQVIVWDNGDYSPDDEGRLSFSDRIEAEERMKRGLEAGKLSFTLRGHKLKGSWTLVKMKQGRNNWLLIKHRDGQANALANILEKDKSIISAFSIEDIKNGKQPSGTSPALPNLTGLPEARQAKFPVTMAPMLASVADGPFTGPDWIFEPKLDGYRTIATINKENIQLLSRNGLNVTEKYAAITAGIKQQPAGQVVFDGEIIALDEKGKPCFQCLQDYLESMGRKEDRSAATAIVYYVFDILFLDGSDLTRVPLTIRKQVLDRVLFPSDTIRLMEYFEGDGEAIYKAAIAQGLEGVVAKRKDSMYQSGQRSPDWLKVKSAETDEFVIGGYTQGTGNRARTFGALILGSFDDKGRLLPAGNVGSGFDERRLTDLKKQLDALVTDSSPFIGKPELNGQPTWVRPELVAEVKFSERTRDGRLRTPVFMRLRDDKTPAQVRPVSPNSTLTPTDPGKPDPVQSISLSVVEDVLKQLKKPRETFAIEVQDAKINLTNLDKVLWPGGEKLSSFTKRDLLIYFTRVSPYLLQHLRDRPITLNRYPGGIHEEHFYQKHWGSPVPEFVATTALSEHGQVRHDYILCQNLATLIWLGQVADLELHTWFSRTSAGPDREVPDHLTDQGEIADILTNYPDFIILDIDPYIYSGAEPKGAEPELHRAGFEKTCETALWLKEILDGLSLPSFVKTSGRTGIHVFVPIVRQLDFNAVHAAARTICEFVLRQHPDEVTIDWAVEKRRGKIFLDYNQNVRGKTLASIFSPRPSQEATVSMPLEWNQIKKAYPTDFTISNVPDILKASGDPWADILGKKHDLKRLLEQRGKKK
jgi:bifunctional non-homologous end joining protein LigD